MKSTLCFTVLQVQWEELCSHLTATVDLHFRHWHFNITDASQKVGFTACGAATKCWSEWVMSKKYKTCWKWHERIIKMLSMLSLKKLTLYNVLHVRCVPFEGLPWVLPITRHPWLIHSCLFVTELMNYKSTDEVSLKATWVLEDSFFLFYNIHKKFFY